MIILRRANDRGHADHGWLKSHHTFSFASYQDPRFMGFGDLRVINEDHVAPGTGFGTHGHKDMEIISYVVSGELTHEDTTGGTGVIRAGEVQVMSAGQGVRHSEKNDHATDPVHFLQIWVIPRSTGTQPRYETKDFGQEQGLTQLVSPDGRDGSLVVDQDVEVYRLLLSEAKSLALPVHKNRLWIQIVKGELDIEGHHLSAGDGAACSDVEALEVATTSSVEALIFLLN